MGYILLFFGGCLLGMTIMTVILSAKSIYLQSKVDNLENKLRKIQKLKRK